MSIHDCPVCHHGVLSHNSGTCTVSGSSSMTRGEESFADRPGGICGCTALPFDQTCITCGKPFVCGLGHEPHDCWSCYQSKKDDADMASFAPLVAALREHGIPDVPDLPWNTGGNIMCLAITLPKGTTPDGPSPYIMFSDHAEWLGFGLYIDSDHVGIGFDAPFASNPWPNGDDWPEEGWAHPGLADQMAAWVAQVWPEIIRWVGTLTYTHGTWTGFGSTHDQYWASYTDLPAGGEDLNDGPSEPGEDAVPLVIGASDHQQEIDGINSVADRI